MTNTQQYGKWVSLIALFFLTALFWPGMMSPDSQSQYAQILSSFYNTHHPINMSLWWSCLNAIYPGPGLMFLFHSLLLWGGIVILWDTFQKRGLKYGWIFLCLPAWPVVFAYTQMIWKDVSFSHCYFLITALLLRCSLLDIKPSKMQLLLIGILLTYGTGAKYQALYLLPIYAWWILRALRVTSYLTKSGLSFFIVIGIYGINSGIEKTLIIPSQNSNAWQMARLYDLAGISYRLKESVFPVYIMQNSNFSMDTILKDYNSGNVDSLVYGKNMPLKTTQNPYELNTLQNTWTHALLTHPLLYIKHRLGVWLKLMNRKPDNYFVCLSEYGHQLYFNTLAIPLAETYMSLIPSIFTRFYWILGLFITALWWGRKKARYFHFTEIPFIFLPVVGITQISLYFFLSMASDLRYVYLSNILGLVLIPFLGNLIYFSSLLKKD